MLWNARNESVRLGKARMEAVRFGSGGKNLVILPGLSDGLTTVKGKALLLAPPYRPFFERYTVWIFSRREPLSMGFTIRDMAADQAEALHALGIERAAVMGVSQGGMIAQYFAADYPDMTEALILAVTAPYANETAKERVERWLELTEQGKSTRPSTAIPRRICADTARRIRCSAQSADRRAMSAFWQTRGRSSPLTRAMCLTRSRARR